jgi:hypothetical protein
MVINAAPATLEVFSKRQIGFESKAQADEKAQHTLEYVSILKRLQRSSRTLDGVLKPLLSTFTSISCRMKCEVL